MPSLPKGHRIVGPFIIKKSLRMWETYKRGEHLATHFTLKEAVADAHKVLGWRGNNERAKNP